MAVELSAGSLASKVSLAGFLQYQVVGATERKVAL